ncbi:multidrug effflux MFS transporter [Yoonia sp. 208BN28-4]|uniref:multidrug effflux MFS transporter n=1 Tax=Yoonia sp. 208BN28-4 TaxID=3126505 RepID=UPI0030A46AE0
MTTAPTVRFLDRSTPPHISTLILLAGISALNMSIFVPSLNGMATYFDTSYGIMQLSISGYLFATAFMQLFIGPVADRFGRRRVVLSALAIYVVATIGAMLSTTIEMFLVFRMCQAIVAAGIVLSRAIVRDMVPQDQAASMIGYVTMGMALVPMFGPMIGGLMDQLFDWRATFVLLTIAGLGVLALCFKDQGETVAAGGMTFRDQVKAYPELLRSPRFWGYSLASAFASGAFFAFLGGSSFVAGTVFNLSPLWTGITLGIPAIGYATGNFLSGRFSVRLGINKMALIGSIVITGGIGLGMVLALLGYNSAMLFFGFCTFLGLGNGLILPNVMAGTLSVRPHLAGTASGLSGAIMIGGGAALSAIAGAFLNPAYGAIPLQIIMFLTSLASLGAILFVIWREAKTTI